ncbi:MAG: aKG-HExxH-type peptide beta-hydroxylase [Sciscionella sp.]
MDPTDDREVPVPAEDVALTDGFPRHRLSWADFDALARGGGGAGVVRRLRQAERSRRLLLLRALVDEVAKAPELSAPLPSPEDAWELLARTQQAAPAVLDLVLAHPYTGSWAGYTTRLLRNQITGVCPFWVHVGYVHALAAAAAIHARIDFHATVPVWQGSAILPTLGLARLPFDVPWSMAEIHGERGRVDVGNESASVRLPTNPAADAPGWWGIRRIAARTGSHALSVRLDDVDPYRGPYEPLPPQRLGAAEVTAWRDLVAEAWALIARCLPDVADALRVGFDSVAPRPLVPFRTPSASSGEAFGSAIIARPSDAAALAAMLVHEFQHIRLSGLLHLTRLCEADPRERFYAAWRDDPRPIGGMVQGVYAFFGVSAFWRVLARAGTGSGDGRAAFEFAYSRAVTWRAVTALRRDPALTGVGRRFVDGIAEVLGPWQDEPVAADVAEAARTAAVDHYIGWRIRHVRPALETVADLADAWLAGGPPARPDLGEDKAPTPVPDGTWSHARADLLRLAMSDAGQAGAYRRTSGRAPLSESWFTVPNATPADVAWATGRFVDAARGYRTELTEDPDRPASWAGLVLALSALGTSPAVQALLHRPELVRAVHRRVRSRATRAPAPEELADWIGRVTR